MSLPKFWIVLATLISSFDSTACFAQSQLVRFDSVFGKFDVALYDNTPLTNANFLSYVDAGDYTNTFIHRSANLPNGEPFVIQGGGFNFENDRFGLTNQRDPVMNEPFNPNIRGTIAMAKLGPPADDPENSATNQWFISTRDNREILDDQNGGFTAFGFVQGDGMVIVDELKAVARFDGTDIHPAFSDLPLKDFVNDGDFTGELLLFSQIVRTTNSLGDLDGSGAITGADIDALYAGYGATPANDIELDLDSDGQVNDSDRDRLIEGVAETRLGDLNFDGRVDVLGDAFDLVRNLGITEGATYAQGDVNGDGRVDVLGDAFELVRNLGFGSVSSSSFRAIDSYSVSAVSAVSTSAIPEPGTPVLFALSAIVGLMNRRRSSFV